MQITLGNYSPFSKMGREDLLQTDREKSRNIIRSQRVRDPLKGSRNFSLFVGHRSGQAWRLAPCSVCQASSRVHHAGGPEHHTLSLRIGALPTPLCRSEEVATTLSGSPR